MINLKLLEKEITLIYSITLLPHLGPFFRGEKGINEIRLEDHQDNRRLPW